MKSARRRSPENWWAPAGAVLAALAWTAARTGRVEVTGASMVPTLQPGDRLVLLRRGGPWRSLRTGDLVALTDPRTIRDAAPRTLVKRVTALETNGVRVEGDNPDHSTDSRVFGTVDRSLVAGRVVYRYHPAERAGRI